MDMMYGERISREHYSMIVMKIPVEGLGVVLDKYMKLYRFR